LPHPSHLSKLTFANEDINPINESGMALVGQDSTQAPQPTQFFRINFAIVDLFVINNTCNVQGAKILNFDIIKRIF